MANSEISKLKRTLGLGGRTNKYKIILNGVGGGPTGETVDILAKSTTMPGRSFNDISIYVQGRRVIVAGEATYDGTWSVVFNDNDKHDLRTKFNKWMEFIDSVATNSRGAQDHTSYMSTAILQQLSSSDNSVTAEYELYNIYPKNLSEITLGDDISSIIEFTVEFNYSHWKKKS